VTLCNGLYNAQANSDCSNLWGTAGAARGLTVGFFNSHNTMLIRTHCPLHRTTDFAMLSSWTSRAALRRIREVLFYFVLGVMLAWYVMAVGHQAAPSLLAPRDAKCNCRSTLAKARVAAPPDGVQHLRQLYPKRLPSRCPFCLLLYTAVLAAAVVTCLVCCEARREGAFIFASSVVDDRSWNPWYLRGPPTSCAS